MKGKRDGMESIKELTKWSSLAAEGWAPSHNQQKREKEEREQANEMNFTIHSFHGLLSLSQFNN